MSQQTVKKKIAFVSHTSKLSGAALSYYTLLGGLDSNRYEIFPILPDSGALFDSLIKDGFKPFLVEPRALFKRLSIRAAKKYLLSSGIDMVYLSCTDKYCRLIAHAADAVDIPIVWHVREPPLGNRVQKSIRLMRKYGAKAIAVSQEQYEVLSPLVNVDKVDNGVDLARFDRTMDGSQCRQRYDLNDRHFVFGIVGTLEKRKNVKSFLLAAESLAKAHENTRFLVVGAGRDDYVSEIKSLVDDSLVLRHKVVFTGSVWNIPEIMSSLDVLVMPSNWEAFPRVVIEGMAMGLPVIASDVGDVSYIIDNGINGIVVPKGDKQALEDAMLDCLLSPEKLKKLSFSAAEKAVREFSQSKHAETMQKHFEAAMGDN